MCKGMSIFAKRLYLSKREKEYRINKITDEIATLVDTNIKLKELLFMSYSKAIEKQVKTKLNTSYRKKV